MLFFIVYITYAVAGITKMEIVSPVGPPQECYTVGLFRAKERAAELKRPLSDFTLGCEQAAQPK
jgi:hypothetical protein